MGIERKHYTWHASLSPLFCAVAALLLVTSCATNPQGEVYRDWASSFSELGIFPVFPPREDVMVGDIYLLPMHPLNSYVIGSIGGLGMAGIHIGYGDWIGPNGAESLAANMENYYLYRPTFPDGPIGAAITSPTNSTPATNTPDAGSPTNKPPKSEGTPAGAPPAAANNAQTNQPSVAASQGAQSPAADKAKSGDGTVTNAPSAKTDSTPATNTADVVSSTNSPPKVKGTPAAAPPAAANNSQTNQPPVTASQSTEPPETDKSKSAAGTDTNAPSAKTNQAPSVSTPDVPLLAKAPADIRTNIFAPLEPVRLKEVAFPEFSFTTISEASAAASVPIEGVLVNAGMDVSKVSQISVKIPVSESYGMPAGRLLRDFYLNDLWSDGSNWYVRATPSSNDFNVISAPAGEMARAMFTTSLHTVIQDNFPAWEHPFKHHRLTSRVDADKNYLYLALISEVFYTRTINITVTGTSAFTGGASAAPASPAQVAQWMGLSKGSTNTSTTTTNSQSNGSTNSTSVSQTVTSTSGAAENGDPFAVADKLRNLPLGNTNGVGGSVRVLGVTAHTIGLQRIFEHPIAVGVRGVVMRISANAVHLNTNSIAPFMSMGGAPTNIPTMGYLIDLKGQ
jgi:hypothetical protein